jgi:cytochrome bd ubiquinol oxidase subunit II
MAIFWVSVLALAILLYVLLDGFDLGVGILYGMTRDETRRAILMQSVATVWDGNETWLIVSGVILWGAFPVVYAVLFSAFYLPVLFMLVGLILRGVAFEFCGKATLSKPFWDAAFFVGSLVVALMQGLMVGALVEGLPVSDGQYAGGALTWLSPFAVLCGVALSCGYALLGACYLIRKSQGEVRNDAYRLISRTSLGLALLVVLIFVYSLTEHLRVMSRWLEQPGLFILPAVGVVAAILLARSVRKRNDRVPFLMATLGVSAAFATFLITFWPYMIPFSITIDQAAAPRSSLSFMFWGEGLFVLPLMLLYTAISYRVFWGKTGATPHEY